MHKSYKEFIKATPIFFGRITVGNKSKIGSFRYEWNYLSNCGHFRYYTFKGKRGKGGFSTKKAWQLLNNNLLSIDPENGNPDNYI